MRQVLFSAMPVRPVEIRKEKIEQGCMLSTKSAQGLGHKLVHLIGHRTFCSHRALPGARGGGYLDLPRKRVQALLLLADTSLSFTCEKIPGDCRFCLALLLDQSRGSTGGPRQDWHLGAAHLSHCQRTRCCPGQRVLRIRSPGKARTPRPS